MAVVISKVTPPAPAGTDRLTVKVNAVVPALPSAADTSLTRNVGNAGPQGASGDAELRGTGVAMVKSAELFVGIGATSGRAEGGRRCAPGWA